jgi:predicted Rossmann fold flavoprotein
MADTTMDKATIWDVAVIGGGAAGMMAAGQAAASGARVILVEKNKDLGEKLKITGGGRCNITNAESDVHALLKHYGEAAKFLYSPFAAFGVADTFSFFESRGLPLVVQARQRAFPATERARDVFQVLKKYLERNHVTVKTETEVTKLSVRDKQVVAAQTTTGDIRARVFIIATGGMSHPETGSTGSGFRWLDNLGHTVKKPSPNIVPLQVAEAWAKSLAGVSLSFMKITFFVEGKRNFSITGKILFTHFGISGPLILNNAHKVKDLLEEGQVTATIDAFPDTEIGALDKQILKIFNQNKNRDFKNVLAEIAPRGTSSALLTLLPIASDQKVHSITTTERRQIVDLLKALPLTITGLMGLDRAVVSDGGVVLTEIDTRTMLSKLYSNLYITGDLLHINRPSGGYSLQLCWTTGYVAGISAGKQASLPSTTS